MPSEQARGLAEWQELLLLAGKDVKTLRSNIAASFPLLSKAQLDDLVPGKAAVVLHKLANRVRLHAWWEENL